MAVSWLPLKHATVLAAVPDWSGVYLIRSGGKVVHVGEAGDLRARLLGLANGDDASLAHVLTREAEFAVEFHLGEAARQLRERELLARHKPGLKRRAA